MNQQAKEMSKKNNNIQSRFDSSIMMIPRGHIQPPTEYNDDDEKKMLLLQIKLWMMKMVYREFLLFLIVVVVVVVGVYKSQVYVKNGKEK